MPVTHTRPIPQSQDGFYATNNPYQVSGPRGFTEFKYMEETTDLFVRLDFPGVSKETVKVTLDSSRKAAFVYGEAPRKHKYDLSGRTYGAAPGLTCDCCIISNVECFTGDGVVRLIISKEKINYHVHTFCSSRGAGMPAPPTVHSPPSLCDMIPGYNPEVAAGHPLAHLRGHNPEGCRGTDPLDPTFMGPVIMPHPFVVKGSSSAYESKQLPNGGLFLRIDMPGVTKDTYTVILDDDNGDVTIMGGAPQAMYDSSGRNYEGKVSVFPPGCDFNRMKRTFECGVLRLIIPPY